MKPTEIAVVQQALQEYIARYPQYTSDSKAVKPGIMQRSFRKNFHTYLRRGDAVLCYISGGDALVFGVQADQPYKGTPDAGWYQVKHHWVKYA